MKKKIGAKLYNKIMENATKKAVDDLEDIFVKKWEHDGTINGGDFEEQYDDDWEDEIYND